ncbi:MAG: [protein-PII] uridylyltransferase [Acidithiobacillales bacterium]
MLTPVPDSIRAHAQKRLDAPAIGLHRPLQVEAFKRFLRLETERLRMRHRSGLGGPEIAASRSHQVDLLLARISRLVASEADGAAERPLERVAVVALGGYGRSELAPFSDVDVLFLHGGRPSETVRRFVEEVLKLLWDVGLTVGHSFRSVRECVALAREDLHSRTALTEARLVTGSGNLFDGLMKEVEERLRGDRKATEAFLAAMRIELAERHGRFGGAVAVQEPNVKEGVGGLRDLHTVLWVVHARFGSRGLAALEAEGRLSGGELRAVRRCLDFLSRVRNELHFASGRKNDTLTLDLQEGVAAGLGYEPKGGLLASEVFMRDYYRRASELRGVCHGFLLRHLEPQQGFLAGLRQRRKKAGFEVREGRLLPLKPGIEGRAERLLEAFTTAQGEGLLLSDELKQTIRANLHLVDRRFRESREASAAFMRLLARRGRVGPILRAMHETGFLGRYLPEWARVTFLVQHDFFHRYTVDEHSLRAVEAIDGVAAGGDPVAVPFGRILDEVSDSRPLYLGMLLHDLGKGRGGRHVELGTRLVARLVERLGLDPATAGDTVFLVRTHLKMSQVSQQRDLSEPSLIASFAESVGSLERLNLLLLLTFADHCAVAPGIWNEWKGALLFELYHKTRARLAGSAVEEGASDAARAHAVELLRSEADPGSVERHFAMLPERYLRATGAERMARHFRLIERRGTAQVALDWRDLAEEHCTELTVTADDRPGFFAKVAGTLTANGINILSVDLFSREDGIVLDTLMLSEHSGHRPVKAARRARAEAGLAEAVAGRTDVGEAVERWLAGNPPRARRPWGRAARPPSVRFDNEASATATVVDVRAQDRPGLAFTIAETLARLGLNITFAKIATDRALALDVFYVTDGGHKLAPEALTRVETALLEALERRGPTAPPSGQGR